MSARRYLRTTPDQIQAGDSVRVTEQYANGTTITYEGEVERVLWVDDPVSGQRIRCSHLMGTPFELPTPERIAAVLSATVEIGVA